MSDKHRIRWYAYADGQKIPRVSSMRGTWGYDVTCSCGWETRTGGAVERHVRELIWTHKFEATA